uniref:Secreted protein n=1 Tax=Strombidium inclinatum TaxID=197538 RepID=A0A7S3IYC0_9SPIT
MVHRIVVVFVFIIVDRAVEVFVVEEVRVLKEVISLLYFRLQEYNMIIELQLQNLLVLKLPPQGQVDLFQVRQISTLQLVIDNRRAGLQDTELFFCFKPGLLCILDLAFLHRNDLLKLDDLVLQPARLFGGLVLNLRLPVEVNFSLHVLDFSVEVLDFSFLDLQVLLQLTNLITLRVHQDRLGLV